MIHTFEGKEVSEGTYKDFLERDAFEKLYLGTFENTGVGSSGHIWTAGGAGGGGGGTTNASTTTGATALTIDLFKQAMKALELSHGADAARYAVRQNLNRPDNAPLRDSW